MGFNSIDILSDSPKNFIFQKETNKTKFGGILTLAFFIVFTFISILYILDYFDSIENGEYSVEYLHMNNFTYDIEAEIMNNNPKMNPNLNFLVDITDSNGNRLNKNFIFMIGISMII